MCNPMLALAGVGVTSSALEIYQQNEAASQMAGAASEQGTIQQQLLNLQGQQINKQTGLELSERARQALRDKAKTLAVMSENGSGAGGTTPMRLIGDTYMQQLLDDGSIKAKGRANMDTLSNRKMMHYRESLSAYNSAKNQIASPLSAIMRIGGAGVKGYISGGGLG